MLARLVDLMLCTLVRFLTGAKPSQGVREITDFSPKVYYANHSSHGDFLLLWVSMPYELRRKVRPVAAKDYWTAGKIRRFLAYKVFNMLLIERKSHHPQTAIEQMVQALETHSLIIFPEGTRKTDDDLSLQPFHSGLYYLAKQRPQLAFIPIWITNMHNVLPKGFVVPIPLLCQLIMGKTEHYHSQEKAEFLHCLESALSSLNPRGRA